MMLNKERYDAYAYCPLNNVTTTATMVLMMILTPDDADHKGSFICFFSSRHFAVMICFPADG